MAIWHSHALLVFLLAAIPAAALDPNRGLAQYHSRVWQAEQGLPRNAVRALAIGQDGRLLVATPGGVVSFDGIRFRPLASGETGSDSIGPTPSVLAARDGAIWIGTYSGLVVRKGSGLRRVRMPEGPGQNSISSLYQDESGAVWVGTARAACRIAGDDVQCLPDSGPAQRMWSRFVDDGTGGVLIASGSGLLRWDRGTVTRLRQTGALRELVYVLYRGRDGQLWGGGSRGLFRLEVHSGTGSIALTRMPGVPGPVLALAEDRGGNLWISSFGNGLYRMNRRGIERDRSITDRFIVSLLVDGADDLWLGFLTDGLMRRTDGEFVPYGVPEGLPSPLAMAIQGDADGSLWLAAMDGGLSRFRDGKLSSKGLPRQLSHFAVYALASGSGGDLWFGNWHDGLYRLDRGRLFSWHEKDGLPGRSILSLLMDWQGDLWAGFVDAGLARFRGGAISPRTTRLFLNGESVRCLLPGKDGSILAGSNRGLYQIRGESIEPLKSPGPVSSLSVDSAGRIWTGLQEGGIGLLDNGSVKAVPSTAGIPPVPIHAVLDDGRGSLWMASDRGILRVPRDQLLAVFAGARSLVEVATYGKEDGMRSTECRGLARPTAWRTSDGDLWFATANSFVRRAAATIDRPAPPPVILETEIDGHKVRGESKLDLAPATRNLIIRFVAIRLAGPHRIQYRYKLEGYDRDWVPDIEDGTARYGHLPRGEYRFLVQARAALGPWSRETAVLEIVRHPNWYQTWWFGVLAACAVGAVLCWTATWYRRRVHGRLSAVLEERNRISREWHDSLMAGFAAVSWQLEVTRDRMHDPGAVSSLELARNMVRHLQAEARRIIWDLRLNLDVDVTLTSAVEDLCRRVAIASHVEVATKVEGAEPSLEGVVVHNLVRIAQEALYNASKHAHARNVLVWLRYDPESVTLGVRDDGCGFVHEQSLDLDGGHLGILGMAERARKLGGRLEVCSAPGAGTEIVATLVRKRPRERQPA